MKRTIFLLMSILLLLTACGDGHKQTSSDKEQSEHKDNHNKNQVKQIATDKKVQGDNYRTILPFKESQARGLLQDNMANGYNGCLLYTSPSPRDATLSRMPSSA